MIFNVPTIRSCRDGFSSLAQVREVTRDLRFDVLELDFSRCGFFAANMAAPLKVILSKVANAPNDIAIINLPSAVEKILRKNQFLCDYGYTKIWDENQTVLPYRAFKLTDSLLFSQYLDEHLVGKGIPRMTPGLDKRFRQSIFEIFQNCAMHSRSSDGIFVCGQFYPKLHHLDLTISDVGVGIRTNVRRIIDPKISSVDAIRWALEEGNTTKTGPQPGGFGLKLLQEFIELNQGKVQIASRLGYYEFSNGEKNFETLASDFPGTTINFEINTNDAKNYGLRSEISSKDIF